ncbi:hypothetical protein GCM10009838_18900 [Catenulispora subtropica]|uniref:Uncharacterized protein n=2 Tax=Catenulispora subtropica TaxID=450798 RepID=A0ABP5CG60_9ACTN
MTGDSCVWGPTQAVIRATAVFSGLGDWQAHFSGGSTTQSGDTVVLTAVDPLVSTGGVVPSAPPTFTLTGSLGLFGSNGGQAEFPVDVVVACR